MSKKLEIKSKFAQYDLDGDGIVTDAELARASEMVELELREWIAILAMCAYPLMSLVIPDSKLDTWSSMSDMIFLSQASIVGMYFGAQAYMARK